MGITQKYLKEILFYNPKTGIFTWKISNSNRVKVGQKAGCLSNTTGYIYIGINGNLYAASRLAWLYVMGYFPSNFVDHVNRTKTDNRFLNLRECNNAENKRNSGKHKDNQSGYVGVFWEKGCKKWRAVICVDYKRIHIGVFNNKIEAAKAYDVAATKYHREFAKLNFGGLS